MKFILTLILLALSQLAFSQVAPDPVFWANLDRSRFSDFGITQLKMRMSYFGEVLGPSIAKLDDNQYDETGAKTRDPITMTHSFSINTQLAENTSFLLSPRFLTPIGDMDDLRETDDHDSLMMDDWFVAVSQRWINAEKWAWDTRLGYRLPTSKKSKNDSIDGQMELRQALTYRLRPELSVSTQFNIRYYLYESSAQQERYRLNQTTFLNYQFNDKWNAQLMYEFEQQHRAPNTGKNQRAWNHTTNNKNQLALGLGRRITRDINLMPYLKSLDTANLQAKTMQVGVWLSAAIF